VQPWVRSLTKLAPDLAAFTGKRKSTSDILCSAGGFALTAVKARPEREPNCETVLKFHEFVSFLIEANGNQ
jgi:hypothetical protein